MIAAGYTSRYDRSFNKLHPDQQLKVRSAIHSLLDYLNHKTPLPAGMGLKKLKDDFWEIRVGIKIGVIFEFSDSIIFWLVGSHDDLLKFIQAK